MNDLSKELIPSMRETLFEIDGNNFKDTLIEIAESGLDYVLNDGLVKDIPVINTLASLCKTGYNIHERNLIKQTAEFINAFNSGSLTEEEIEKHKQELEEDPKKAEREIERVMLLLSKNIDTKKSRIQGSFYRHYVSGVIDWPEFCELSDVNSRMFTSDYYILEDIMCEPKYENNGYPSENMHRVSRLQALGLVIEKNVVTSEDQTLVFLGANQKYDISALGKMFARLME